MLQLVQERQIALETDVAHIGAEVELLAGRSGEVDRVEMELDDTEQFEVEAAHMAGDRRIRRSAADRRGDDDVELEILGRVGRGEMQIGDTARRVRPVLHIGLPRQRGDDLGGRSGGHELRRLFRRAGDVQDHLDDVGERNDAEQLGVGDGAKILFRIEFALGEGVERAAGAGDRAEIARQAADIQIRRGDAAGLVAAEGDAERVDQLDENAALVEVALDIMRIEHDLHRAGRAGDLLQRRDGHLCRRRRIEDGIEDRLTRRRRDKDVEERGVEGHGRRVERRAARLGAGREGDRLATHVALADRKIGAGVERVPAGLRLHVAQRDHQRHREVRIIAVPVRRDDVEQERLSADRRYEIIPVAAGRRVEIGRHQRRDANLLERKIAAAAGRRRRQKSVVLLRLGDHDVVALHLIGGGRACGVIEKFALGHLDPHRAVADGTGKRRVDHLDVIIPACGRAVAPSDDREGSAGGPASVEVEPGAQRRQHQAVDLDGLGRQLRIREVR